jgi:hypothetical protein
MKLASWKGYVLSSNTWFWNLVKRYKATSASVLLLFLLGMLFMFIKPAYIFAAGVIICAIIGMCIAGLILFARISRPND